MTLFIDTETENQSVSIDTRQKMESGRITGSESVVLFNCATGLKYPMPAVHNTLNHHKTVDYNSLV